ncbi:MAG: GFA family protein [Xanthobacteraceae bacterium]
MLQGDKAESSMTAHGSCLCGSVTFAVDLPFDRFVHCHCSRCRKATGMAHAGNAVVKAAALRWLRGGELVVRYDLPTARSFATSFCRRCGSPLPHFTRSGRECRRNAASEGRLSFRSARRPH